MKKAWIFPGQGTQYVGMGRGFFDSFLIAKETFQEADDLLRFCLSKVIFEGPEETLTRTDHAQLAIFVTSMAILRTLSQQLPDLKPAVCAGLSLGEYTALCASGRLKFSDALFLVRERAERMSAACEAIPGTMAAVLGLDAESVEAATKGIEGVWVANYNAPGQTVISGTQTGIAKATPLLKEKGAKRVMLLTVHGAFHSALMQSAQDGLAPFIERIPLTSNGIELVMNVPGDFVKTEAQIRHNLIAQVTQPVRWEQGIQATRNAGVELFLEIGCGKTLTGLNKKMGIESIFAIDQVADLEGIHAMA